MFNTLLSRAWVEFKSLPFILPDCNALFFFSYLGRGFLSVFFSFPDLERFAEFIGKKGLVSDKIRPEVDLMDGWLVLRAFFFFFYSMPDFSSFFSPFCLLRGSFSFHVLFSFLFLSAGRFTAAAAAAI